MDLFNAFDGLIFDCDGTLIDSMPMHYIAWTTVLDRYGIPFPEDRFYAMGGVPAHTLVSLLSAEAGVAVDPVAVAGEKEAYFLENASDIVPIASTLRVVQFFSGVKPMAVATGGYRSVVSVTLGRTGLMPYFQAVVCADDVERHKPEPDTYIEAAKRLGLSPAACAAFEDTDIGIEAIQRAGMRAFDVRDVIW